MQARSFFVGLVLLAGVGLVPPGLRADDLPPAPQGVEVQARGPVHEAFAPLTAEPVETKPVPKQPPEPLEELAPEEKPEGEVIWIKGYWAWDEDRNDYLWVSGTWRVSPPGKQWVPGYWREGNGWQWVPGFWTSTAKDPAASPDISYLPPPPPAPPMTPPGTAPAPGTFWVPGHYVWAGTDYVWQAGYWARSEPNYVWVSAHYRWTPSGHIYIEGYWDLAVSKRGFLYAPVVIDPAVVNVSFSYTPVYAVRDTVVLDSLFVRPVYCHYYFGDYYGPVYADRGFENCYVYSQRNYDSIVVYETPRRDPGWLSIQITLGNDRAAGRAPLPPRTLVAQQTIINQTVINQTTINQTNINQTNINQTNINQANINKTNVNQASMQMLAPASQVAKEKGVQVVKLDETTRKAAVQQAVALKQAGTARAKAEASAPPVTKGMAPRTAKLETVHTQTVKSGFVPPTPKTNVAATAPGGTQHPSGATTPPGGTQHPGATTSPTGTQHPTATTSPTGTQHPGATTPPTDTQHPAATTAPTGTQHPGATTPPTDTQHPGATTPPPGTQHPATTTPPTGTQHPATTTPPTGAQHPATTTPPTGTQHPATTPPPGPQHPATTPPTGAQHPATPPTGTQHPATTPPPGGQRTTPPGTTPPGTTSPGGQRTTPPGTTPPGTTPPGTTPPGTTPNGQPGTAPTTSPPAQPPGH